jgi:hypothetical protein
MAIGHLLLFFLACGVATFPLTLIAMRVVASLAPGGRIARKLDDTFEKALTASIVVWVLAAFVSTALRSTWSARRTEPSAASSAASCQGGGGGAVPGAVNANARHQS